MASSLIAGSAYIHVARPKAHLFQPSTTAPSTTAASANMPAMAPQPVSVSAFLISGPDGVSATLICVNVSGCTAVDTATSA